MHTLLGNYVLRNKSTGDHTKENHFVVVSGIDTNARVVHLNFGL